MMHVEPSVGTRLGHLDATSGNEWQETLTDMVTNQLSCFRRQVDDVTQVEQVCADEESNDKEHKEERERMLSSSHKEGEALLRLESAVSSDTRSTLYFAFVH